MKTHLRAEEVAVVLGCSINTVYNYRKDGLLTQEPVGRKRMFITAQVHELKEKLAAATAGTVITEATEVAA